jgi:hypothetical protein
MSTKYALEFALDTLPPQILIGELYDIKICIVHLPTKGIGKRFPFFSLSSINNNIIAYPHQFEFKLFMRKMGNMQEEIW